MGADADIIAVGPFKVFRDLGLLDYPVEHYTYMDADTERPARDEHVVICTIAMAATTDQSTFLSEICNVGWPGLADCQVRNPVPPSLLCNHDSIGEDDGEKVFCRLKTLASMPDVKMYFRPNY